jgi:hypothetical protein
MQRFTSGMRAADTVRSVLELAGVDYETGLAQLEAVSEKQRAFGADIRIRALANIWSEQVLAEYQTSAFAQAVLRAANRHTSAKWWIERESHTLVSFNDLDDDIEQELENEN